MARDDIRILFSITKILFVLGLQVSLIRLKLYLLWFSLINPYHAFYDASVVSITFSRTNNRKLCIRDQFTMLIIMEVIFRLHRFLWALVPSRYFGYFYEVNELSSKRCGKFFCNCIYGE